MRGVGGAGVFKVSELAGTGASGSTGAVTEAATLCPRVLDCSIEKKKWLVWIPLLEWGEVKEL